MQLSASEDKRIFFLPHLLQLYLPSFFSLELMFVS